MQCLVCEYQIDENKIIAAECFKDFLHCFNQKEIKRKICDNCGLIFGPIEIINLSKEELSEAYARLYQYHKEVYNTADYFNFLNLSPSKDKYYLNYACGSNPKYISKIQEDGYNLVGSDISLGLENTYLFKNLDTCPIQKFHGLISHNYIEHVQNSIEWFIKLNKLLHIDSTMIHSTGCFGYVVESTPFHLFFHTQKSIAILCDKTGFTLQDIKKFTLQHYEGLNKDNIRMTDYDDTPLRPNEAAYLLFKKIKDV